MHQTACQQILVDAAHHLGMSLSSVVNIINPEMIIFNNSPVFSYEPVMETIRTTILRETYASDLSIPELAVSHLGENACAIGAAASVLENTFG